MEEEMEDFSFPHLITKEQMLKSKNPITCNLGMPCLEPKIGNGQRDTFLHDFATENCHSMWNQEILSEVQLDLRFNWTSLAEVTPKAHQTHSSTGGAASIDTCWFHRFGPRNVSG